MKVGDVVRQVDWLGYGLGVVTQEDRDRGIVFVHFRDRAHWIVTSLVEVVSASR